MYVCVWMGEWTKEPITGSSVHSPIYTWMDGMMGGRADGRTDGRMNG